MQRILGLDLDFLLVGVATWRGREDDRLDAADFPPWSVEQTLSFLRNRCGLDRRLPGFAVEHHGELFSLWRDAIDAGTLMEGFDPGAEHIQLAAIRSQQELHDNLLTPAKLTIAHFEPRVPFKSMRWDAFQADQPFDFVCLARSPPFTPPESDVLYDEICRRFIDTDMLG